MARRSRYLHYDEQMTALMKRGNLSQIPADRNHTRGSVIEKLKMLGAVRGKLILQLHGNEFFHCTVSSFYVVR